MNWLDDTLCVHYDGRGERIKSHQMDGLEVATSIKAIVTIYSEAFKEANKVHQSNFKSEVLMEGSTQAGSLKWLMKVLARQEEAQMSIGETETEPLHKNVLASIKRVVDLIKDIDLSTTEIVIHELSTGHAVTIDGNLVEIDELECAILTNNKILGAFSDLAKPLDGENIDTVTISSCSGISETFEITSDNRSQFLGRKGHTKIVEDGEFDGFYYIENLSYSPDSKWKLVNKDSPKDIVNGIITDVDFLARVSENAERFAKDDLLEVSGIWFKEKAKLTGNVKTTYIISKVKDHIPAGDHQWQLK
ncbi:hypothetical protein QPB17_000170 [Vibrio cholerae]|nr:hypothetical protein [Vibrio cholerae]ELT8458664.1 hypothetical protein [Vibrio cholerae]